MKAKLLYMVIDGLLFYSVIVTVQVVNLHIQTAGLQKLPSIKDIQRRIGCEKIDGRLCKMWCVEGHSETQEKWGAAICQQYADKYINNETMGIKGGARNDN